MNVRQLRAELMCHDPDAVVTVIDPHLHVECHIAIQPDEWTVGIESTGTVVTEEDVS